MVAYEEILDREIEWTMEKITAYFRDIEGIMPAERIQKFDGGKADKIPLSLPLSDEWGAHYNGFKISEICLEAKKLVYSHLNVCWRFKLERWGSVFPHYYQLGPSAVGVEVEFPEDGPPMSPREIVNDFSDVDRLKVPNMRTGGYMPYHWEVHRIWKEKLSDLYPSCTTQVPGPFIRFPALRRLLSKHRVCSHCLLPSKSKHTGRSSLRDFSGRPIPNFVLLQTGVGIFPMPRTLA